MNQITKAQVDAARDADRDVWMIGNRVLYNLCRRHPKHTTAGAIASKIWLIGRSYAASIERRPVRQHSNEDFYADVVIPTLRKVPIDDWLASVKKNCNPGCSQTITIHKRLMDIFFDMTGLDKRSLASKYLHFHKPQAFYIFDSRAQKAIRKVVPRKNLISALSVDEFDKTYRDFCRRCTWLHTHIRHKYGYILTPREIDRLLLSV